MQYSLGMVIVTGFSMTLSVAIIGGTTLATSHVTDWTKKYSDAMTAKAQAYQTPDYPTCVASVGLTQNPAGADSLRMGWSADSQAERDEWQQLSLAQQRDVWENACPGSNGETWEHRGRVLCKGGSREDQVAATHLIPPAACGGITARQILDTRCQRQNAWHYANPGTDSITKVCSNSYRAGRHRCWWLR